LTGGDVAGCAHPVIIPKLFCHRSSFKVSHLQEVWGYAYWRHPVEPFVMLEQCLFPVS
jgi:hypothetical protein